MHLNIYVERMKREFKCEVDVGKPQVAYQGNAQLKLYLMITLIKNKQGGAGQFAKVVGHLETLGENSRKKL